MAKWDLPTDKVLATKVIEHEARKSERFQENGVIGFIFGAPQGRDQNIAGFVLVAAFIMLACVLLFGQDSQSLTKKDELLYVSGIITTTLGFVFGRSRAR